jgi:catechol-2,3-dioxygenase
MIIFTQSNLKQAMENRFLCAPIQSIHAHVNIEIQNIKSSEEFYSKAGLSSLEMSVFCISEIGE